MGRQLVFLTILITLVLAVGVYPAVYKFSPDPIDLDSLDHAYYYAWGVHWTLPSNESLVDVTLAIKDINNWTAEDNVLYIHLLDNPVVGVRQWYDNEGNGDAWNGAGPLVATYTDHNSYAENLNYSLKDLGLLSVFQTYAQNGVVGFGFDPDCHYYNDGITMTIKTKCIEVPEPGSMAIILTGFGSLVAIGIKRYRRE
jgi:hypothetical protein